MFHTFEQVIKLSLLDFEYLTTCVKSEQCFSKLPNKKKSVMNWLTELPKRLTTTLRDMKQFILERIAMLYTAMSLYCKTL